MKTLLALANNKDKLHLWQQMVDSEFFRQLVFGVREVLPCQVPDPVNCTEGYLGTVVGRQTTRDLILDVILRPETWVAWIELAQSNQTGKLDQIRAMLKDDFHWDEKHLTDDKLQAVMQELGINPT